MQREPGLLRSVLVTALDLAHVHAAPANSALFLPEVSLFDSVFLGAERARYTQACEMRVSRWRPAPEKNRSKKERLEEETGRCSRAPRARGQDQVP